MRGGEGTENDTTTKFMFVLSLHHYHLLEEEAKIRGCTVQQLLRVVIVPFWLKDAKLIPDTRPWLREKEKKSES